MSTEELDERVPKTFEEYVRQHNGEPVPHVPTCEVEGETDCAGFRLPRPNIGSPELVCEGCLRERFAHETGEQWVSDALLAAIRGEGPYRVFDGEIWVKLKTDPRNLLGVLAGCNQVYLYEDGLGA
ncbi:MAG: hypothetical protein FWD42_01720 [Solirubrobacterales bacterium]|nr:hypothetical protein [Solirubrobacterales bacterium]